MPSGQRQQQQDAQHREDSQGDQCDLEHLDDGVCAPDDAGQQLALKALRRARPVPRDGAPIAEVTVSKV